MILRIKGSLLPAFGLCGICGVFLLYILNSLPAYQNFRSDSYRRSVPVSAVTSTRLLKLMRKLNLVSMSTAEGSQDRLRIHLNPAPTAEFPSSKVIPLQERNREYAVISLAIDDSDLNDKRYGILKNPSARGASWERPATVTITKGGRKLIESGVGVRLHGGKSRFVPGYQSYRLYFRARYGDQSFNAAGIFDSVSPTENFLASRLVVHSDKRFAAAGKYRKWQFINPLSFSLARKINLMAPLTMPAKFFLNGQEQGVFVLTEHVSRDYLRNHFGHDDFVFVRSKDQSGSEQVKLGSKAHLERLWQWAKSSRRPLTIEQVEQRLDLDSLSKWFFMQLFSVNGDPFQGPIVLNLRDALPRWQWILLDMDAGFRNSYTLKKLAWKGSVFSRILANRSRRLHIESLILYRLINEDVRYNQRLLSMFDELLANEFSGPVLLKEWAHYHAFAQQFSIQDQRFIIWIDEFLKNRPEVFRKQYHSFFKAMIDKGEQKQANRKRSRLKK